MPSDAATRNESLYLNMAGAGLNSNRVLERIAHYQNMEKIQGAYETEAYHEDLLEKRVYSTISGLLNCKSEEIALFDSATRAWMEIIGRMRLTEPGVLITSPYEYAGNLQILHTLAKRYGHTIATIPLSSSDDLDLDWLETTMSDRVRLVSIVHIPSNSGIVNPIEKIGEIVAPYSAIYIVDACQSVGQRPIDVKRVGCDALTAAGRKFLSGPRGTGFAYVSTELLSRMEHGYVDLHRSHFTPSGEIVRDLTSARALELAERNCAAIVGLELAIMELRNATARPDLESFAHLRQELTDADGINAVDPGSERGFIFTFYHDSIDALTIVQRLKRLHVGAWRIHGAHTPLFMLKRGIGEAVRLSSTCMTQADAEGAIGAVREAVRF